jgi:hypothetical protein
MPAPETTGTHTTPPESADRATRSWAVSLLLAAIVLLLPDPSAGQAWRVEAEAGVGLPGPELSDLHDPGPAVAVGVLHHPVARLGVGLRGGLEILGGKEITGGVSPTLRLWRYELAGTFAVLPAGSPVRISLAAGAGATTFDSDRATAGPLPGVPVEGTVDEISDTFFSTHAGIRVGVAATGGVRVFAGGTWRWMAAEKRLFALATPLVGGLDGDVFTFPLTVGASVGL